MAPRYFSLRAMEIALIKYSLSASTVGKSARVIGLRTAASVVSPRARNQWERSLRSTWNISDSSGTAGSACSISHKLATRLTLVPSGMRNSKSPKPISSRTNCSMPARMFDPRLFRQRAPTDLATSAAFGSDD